MINSQNHPGITDNIVVTLNADNIPIPEPVNAIKPTPINIITNIIPAVPSGILTHEPPNYNKSKNDYYNENHCVCSTIISFRIGI